MSTTRLWFSKRFLVAITLFAGFANTIILMSNINIAIIEMTSDKSITNGDITVTKPPEFQWDRATVGVISSMHSYAGLFPFLGSILANKFGGAIGCMLSLMGGGILTMLHEAILHINFYLFLIFRILVGFSTTSYFVSSAEIFSRWFPKKERSTLITISYCGTNFGTIIIYPLYGYVADRWGWQMVFYASGMTSVIVSLIFWFIVKNTPIEDKWISKQELIYIQKGINTDSYRKGNHPYKKIFSSGPVLALCAAKFSFAWVQSLMYESLPLYVKDMTQTRTAETGLISSIPVIAPIIVYPLSGIFFDYLKNHSEISLTKLHKTFLGLAYTTMSALLLVETIISNFSISMGILAFMQIIQWFSAPITDLLTVHIAPNDASIIAALITTTMSTSFILSRTFAGLLTTTHSFSEWSSCFYISDVILISGAIVFLWFGSSEAQSWSLSANEECRYLIKNEDQI